MKSLADGFWKHANNIKQRFTKSSHPSPAKTTRAHLPDVAPWRTSHTEAGFVAWRPSVILSNNPSFIRFISILWLKLWSHKHDLAHNVISCHTKIIYDSCDIWHMIVSKIFLNIKTLINLILISSHVYACSFMFRLRCPNFPLRNAPVTRKWRLRPSSKSSSIRSGGTGPKGSSVSITNTTSRSVLGG